MPDERLEVSVTFDERGYIGSAPELRLPVMALSLGGLRRKIEALLLPADHLAPTSSREVLHASLALRLHAALRPHEALDRTGQQEQVSLPVRSVVLNDLLGRNPGPLAVQPRVPDILRVSVAGIFDLKLRFDNVGGTAAEQRFRVQLSIGVQLVVGTLERFKPLLMRPLGPIAMREGHVRKRGGDRDRQYERANHARASFGTVGQAQ
jgi:hypothetical protein